MLILISGPNSSGKSVWAERLTASLGQERYYIATMVPVSEDNRVRIEKHRRQRAQYGFHTLELPYGFRQAQLPESAVVLLEDVSNLLANHIFESRGTLETVFGEILALVKRCRAVVAVTIGGLDQEDYTGETADYICGLNRLNELLRQEAQAVVEMRDGQPWVTKGEIEC